MSNQEAKSDLQKALGASRSAFWSAAGFSMVVNLLMLVPVIYMLQLYDRVIPTGNQDTLIMLTLIVVLLFVVMAGLDWVRGAILVRQGARLEVTLSQRLYQVTFQAAMQRSSGAASSQPIDDFRNFRQFLSGKSVTAFFDAPWMPIYIGVMFMLHPWFGWIAVATAILSIAIAVVNEKLNSETITDANRHSMANRSALNVTLMNNEVIHAMGMRDTLFGRWEEKARTVLGLQLKAQELGSIFGTLSRYTRLLAQSLVLGTGAYLAIMGLITPGLMIAGSILLGRALAPIDLLVGNWKSCVNARNEYRRLNELLNAIPADAERMELPAPLGAITVEKAVIAPPNSKTAVIKGISFSIAPGETIGLIGPSGSGKSSLIRGLLGIWPTLQGHVRLDGADIASWDRTRLGPHIGYLPQDIELFEGSVSLNISRFTDPDPQQVIAAAKLAGVHDMILHLPEGYDTKLGAGGNTLSGGQLQRIGLARALYGNPALVILDEPNSNLDDRGEFALKHALTELHKRGATVVIVSHRPSVLGQVDKLLVLQDGAVTSFGKTSDVLEKRNLLSTGHRAA